MSNRSTFWLVWGIAVIPVVAACVMYFGQIGLPKGRTHHGELVEIGTTASDVGLPAPSEPATWQVILASGPDCDGCQSFSEGISNFHTAIGRERERVIVLELNALALSRQEPSIWVIDPLGNVVLRFEPSVNPTLILKDLKKLLKLSKVG